MRKIYGSILALVMSAMAYGQYYQIPYPTAGKNPGDLNKEDEFPLANITGWSSILAGPKTTPEWSATQNLPFSFQFNGQAVTEFKVSSSGVLTFDVAAANVPATANESLPSANIPDKSIVVWGLEAKTDDHILTKTFGTAPNRQYWIQFNSFSEANLQSGWTYWSIVLEETTNNIYIVDHRSQCVSGTSVCTGKASLTVGIQIDATTATQLSESPNVPNRSTNSQLRDDNWYYKFVQGTQPAYDLEASRLTLAPYYVATGGDIDIKGTLRNVGTTTITSIDINYTIDGGNTVTATLNGINISPLGTYNFTHPTKYTPVAGTRNIEVWASNLNGNADEKTENDRLNGTFQVYASATERKSLHEVFTSSTCPPCKPGNENLENNIFPFRDNKITVVKYQYNFPGVGDPYYTQEAAQRGTFYGGINSVPRLEVDGAWNDNPNNYNTIILDNYQTKPALVEVTAEYTINHKTVSVDVNINPLADINSSSTRLYVAVVEGTTRNNVKNNGETEFVNVMKKMLPAANGTLVGALSEGVEKDYSLTYTFNGEYILPANASSPVNHATNHTVEEFSDLKVVVWLQDATTREVFQSAWATGGPINVSTNKLNADFGLKLFPNPANNQLFVNYNTQNATSVKFTLIDALGKVVKVQTTESIQGENSGLINVNELANGVYFLEVEIDGQKQSTRFVVAH